MFILIIVVFHVGFIGMNGIFIDDSEEISPTNSTHMKNPVTQR